MRILWVLLKENGVWCGKIQRFARASVDEICCSVECLNPKFDGQVSLEKKCAKDVVDCTQSSLGLAILRGCVRTV